MSSTLRTLTVIGVLAIGTPASACRWFGTQIECRLGWNPVVIGTQAAEAPSYVAPLPLHGFHGDDGLSQDRVAVSRSFQIDVQNIGADPRLCRRIGNETYCY